MNEFSRILEGVERHRLSNGLTVLVREDHSIPIVTTMVWYRVGSRCEQPGTTGVSHFLEHMMFKGTRRYRKGEIDAITTLNGGANNAFTANDYTAYYFSFASDRWRPALEMEADRMNNSIIDPEEFRLEKQVVLEELKMELDEPWCALRQAVETASFPNHPYGFPIIGRREDLVALTPRQMISHYRKYYVPSNAVLVLVGDFRAERALAETEELFGSIPAAPRPECPVFEEERKADQIRVELRRDVSLDRLLIGFPAPSIRQSEHYTLHVLDRILAEGKLCRFYQRLVERDSLVSFMSADFSDTLDPYLFLVRLELLPGASAQSVESAVFQELDRLSRETVSGEEIQRAVRQCLLSFLSGFETTLDQAVQLGLMETLARFEYWRDYAARIEAVTARDLRAYARQYLAPEQATIGTLLHENSHPTPM